MPPVACTFSHFNTVNPVDISPTPQFDHLLADLIERRELRREQMRWFMEELMAGHCGEAEAAAVLIALRMKGETAGEMAAAAEVLRERMVLLVTGRPDLIGTCGGGLGCARSLTSWARWRIRDEPPISCSAWAARTCSIPWRGPLPIWAFAARSLSAATMGSMR